MLPLKQRLLILVLFAIPAAAQSTAFTISNLNLAGAGANNTYTTTITGSGTASFGTLGNANVVLSGTSTRERGLSCGSYIQLSVVATFNATDSLTLLLNWPSSALGTAQPFAVTGGTGIYKNSGGSGTLTIGINPFNLALTGSGSGTLTSSPAAISSILPEGIVPVFSSVPIVQPASWISIYGSNLANTTAVWNGDFPTSLGNVSVTIDNKPGYLWLVSPSQINVQVPSDNVVGCVNVVVTGPNGTATSQVTLQPQQPSFSLLSAKYIVGEIPTPNGSGAYGNGVNAYDLVGPTGAFAFKTRPVKVGETVVLFGVGFGATQTNVPAGQFPAAPTPNVLATNLMIGGVKANVTFAGLIGAGLYQLNVMVPSVPSGDQVIQASIGSNPLLFSANSTQSCYDPDPQGSMPTSCTVYITVQ